MKLSSTIESCKKNGERLLEDAKLLYDFEKYPSAYGLAKLAEEEFAKAFILKLVESGALDWSKEVQKSLNHHVSKQIISLILDFISSSDEDFLEKLKNGTLFKRPPRVADAINIYIHEILRRWESSNWFWAEDPNYGKEAKLILNKKEEKMKHGAFYIKVSSDGRAVDSTTKFTKEVVEEEIDKTDRYRKAISIDNCDLRYSELVEILRLMKN